ncbi:hypothetical protein PVAND_007227 [Polypedilum vanderplanki]|uniref:Protein kintoun n=1 Tax=Polypedilum vanderplanki TaxID=319348 RepID=A0A9J6C6B8_POLVA|nr:hypothetical protein PVAND_007227 [Polypedilum vanderplanki]
MSFSSTDWKDLNVTKDEVNRIGEALKHKEFRQLFIDYCEEITDPENRKLYEQEITQLEAERGINITFINPEPGYVIKTSSNGSTKTFINIASNDKVDKPSNKSSTSENGQRGLIWTVPHTLAPPRRDVDKKGDLCHVFDVVFHPDTLHLASRNSAFRQLVNDTAINAVQQSFSVQLDRTNIKFPKIAYKGIAKPTVIRKKIDNFDASSIEPSPIDSIYPPLKSESKETTIVRESDTPIEKYTTPKYKIVQRRDVQYHEMTHELDAKANLTIPHELVVTIDLPLLNTTQDANLDVTSKQISLMSEKPAKYKCEIALPYEVNEEDGNARFDKSKRQLIITLPVKSKRNIRIIDFLREDSGIESDQPISKTENSDESDESPVNETTIEKRKDEVFLDENIEYILPNFTFNQIQELLSFTLHVKNVDPSSIVINRKDLLNIAHIKFSSIGSGYFPIHYSFCVKFPSQQGGGIFREITAEAWDNNVIFQFELNEYDFEAYMAGLNDENLTNYDIAEKLIGRQAMTSQGKEIEDDSLCIGVEVSEKEDELVIEIGGKKEKKKNKRTQGGTSNDDEVSEDVFDDKKSIQSGDKRQTKKAMRKRAKKARSMSESYCDELKVINELDLLKIDNKKPSGESKSGRKKEKVRSLSESSDEEHHNEIKVQNHHKYKSILKNRDSFSECHEMSSMDEHSKNMYSFSADDYGICESHDSLSESCKKQVRFSDIIMRQLFRSNTSILGQKKKNQKKKASRKRALERRHSEGSENEKHEEEDKDDDDEEDEEDEKPQKRDSGVDLTEKRNDNSKTSIKIKNKKANAEKAATSTDIQFKSGMIFDLEM